MNKILLTAAVIVATSFTLCAQNNKEMKTSKTLVAYFSATGTTAQVAKDIADLTGGTLYEIAPKSAYTSADLDWNNKQSRSSVEMNDPQARPELKTTATDLSTYDTIHASSTHSSKATTSKARRSFPSPPLEEAALTTASTN